MNEKQRTADAYSIFSSPQGELVMKDLESKFGTNAPVFIKNEEGNYCHLHAAIRDGQRSVILHLTHANHRTQTTQEIKANQAVR
jgi:hypothetical protein